MRFTVNAYMNIDIIKFRYAVPAWKLLRVLLLEFFIQE